MNATELRIGNWVEIQGLESKIILVDTEGCICENEYCEDFENNNITQNLQPISLTEEWLERFGFSNGELIGFDITKGDIGFDFWIVPKSSDYTISVNLKHVHQLQNLCFALTESELKQNEDE